MKRAGEIWSGMGDKEKKKYNEMHEEDLKRVEKAKKELEEKGYYTNADGSRSDEVD